MNRRRFLNATALGFASGLVRGGARAPGKIEAVAFDSFAIFDPRPIGAVAEAVFPGNGAAVMALWRSRQFEYTWLRTLTGSYVNFWQVTQDALVFACACRRRDESVVPSPTAEDLLVVYLPDEREWTATCARMLAAGFATAASLNPYWERRGRTFVDPDGYRVVVEQDTWVGVARQC